VTVISRRGSVEAVARVTRDIKFGVVYMPFHYAESAANELTNSAADPVSKIPELKVCAVRVEKQIRFKYLRDMIDQIEQMEREMA
jgi:formate dehydrogenase major subunit